MVEVENIVFFFLLTSSCLPFVFGLYQFSMEASKIDTHFLSRPVSVPGITPFPGFGVMRVWRAYEGSGQGCQLFNWVQPGQLKVL